METREKEDMYIVIVPEDPRHNTQGVPKFLVSLPIEEKELEKATLHFQQQEFCNEGDIQKVKLYMPIEEFEKKWNEQGTYWYEDAKNSILKDNEKYKPKEIKPLSDLAAETLAQHPKFFNEKQATLDAKEKFEEAKKHIPKK